jgi:hypothetical protein
MACVPSVLRLNEKQARHFGPTDSFGCCRGSTSDQSWNGAHFHHLYTGLGTKHSLLGVSGCTCRQVMVYTQPPHIKQACKTTFLPTHSVMLFASLLIFLPQAIAQCYWRNGTINPFTIDGHTEYGPCSQDRLNPLSRICCADHDACLPNGICQSKDDGSFWRESCTRSNWTDGSCQSLCSDEVR